jgi:hypothetical protein
MREVDNHSTISARRVISPQNDTGNSAMVGQIIDRQGFDSLEFIIATGTLATNAATFTVLVEDGNTPTLTDNAAVDDSFLLGTEALASPTGAQGDKVFKIGYCGNNRYVRLTITPANNSGNAYISAIAVLGGAHALPVTS